MPNSYPIHPTYDQQLARRRTMPKWKLEDSAVIEDVDATPTTAPAPEPFDPSEHNIEEVKTYINDLPSDGGSEVQRVYDAEVKGKGRSSLLDWLSGS